MYRFNRSHLLATAVLSAINVRAELLTRLSEAVRTLRPTPVHASVFGSFARGDGDEESDVDMFLVLPTGAGDSPEWEAQMRDLEDQVHAWTGNRLETLTLDIEGFRGAVGRGEYIIDELVSDAHLLLGQSIGSMVQGR